MEKINFLNNPEYQHIKTQEGLQHVYNSLVNEPVLGVDTETTGLDPYTCKLVLFQIGSAKYSFVVEAKFIKDWSLMIKLLTNPKQLKVLQNAKFDYKIIKVHLGCEIENIFDTMVAESLLVCGLPRNENKVSLEFLTKKYIGATLEKEVRKTFFRFTGASVTDEQARYAALDIIVMFPIFEKQYELLKKNNLLKVAKLEFKVIKIVGNMELRGFHIDVDKWRSHIKKLEADKILIAKELQEAIRPYYNMNTIDLFGNYSDAINLNSQVQLMDLFNNKLGLNVASTGVKVLTGLKHPIAQLMLKYRQLEKLISAFGETVLEKINPVTKRLHPDYMQMGTDTGRFSCSNPNLQQIPSKGEASIFRTFFTAPPGRMLVTCDYSQQEMRVLADMSSDDTLLEAYLSGKDLHSLTAAQMYGLEYTEDFKDVHKDLRQAAKTINFGLVYGRGPGSLAQQLGVTIDEAKALVEKYFEKLPKVGNWLENSAKKGIENGYVETLLGRKRYFVPPDPADPNFNKQKSSIERASKNMPIQGTSADMTKLAMINIEEKFKLAKIDGGIIHTLHDEIVSEVPSHRAKEAFEIQRDEMINAGKAFLSRCPIDAEGGFGHVWSH
mgnify:CR=1 FL=1